MQPLSRISQPGGKLLLYKGVDILSVRVNEQRAAFQIFPKLFQLRADLFTFALLNDPLLSQHGSMGDAALNILPKHAAVYGNTGIKIVRFRIRFLLKAPFPKLHGVFSFLG